MALRAISPMEEFSFRKDYLNASNNYKLLETIQEYGDGDPEGFCLTDHVYVFNNKMERKRMKLLITIEAIYLFKGKKAWKPVRRYDLCDLERVIISAKNFTLTVFSFRKGYDILLDSYRRIDIILYIAQRMKKAKLNLFKIVYLRNFKMRKREKSSKDKDYDLSLIESSKSELPILQETFRNARRAGYMKLRKKKLFGKSFTEYFFILSNLGLIYFKSFGVSLESVNHFVRVLNRLVLFQFWA